MNRINVFTILPWHPCSFTCMLLVVWIVVLPPLSNKLYVICVAYCIPSTVFLKRNMLSSMEYLWSNWELLVHDNNILKYCIYMDIFMKYLNIFVWSQLLHLVCRCTCILICKASSLWKLWLVKLWKTYFKVLSSHCLRNAMKRDVRYGMFHQVV